MTHFVEDNGRRKSYFHKDNVREALPEHFREEYPNFVQFLEYYYDFLAEQEPYNFDKEIHQLTTLRDVYQTPDEYLDLIIFEIGSRLKNDDLFTDGRFATSFLNELYKVKGSRNSIESFFRLFFQTDVNVEYPKNEIFRVGEDFIGPESIRYIQDYKRYQAYSILIKVGLGVSQYRELYKKFVHPAGWYFEGETQIEGNAFVSFSTPIALFDSALVAYETQFTLPIVPFTEMHGLLTMADDEVKLLYKLDSVNGSPTHSGTAIADITNQTVGDLDSAYTIRSLVTPNSETFDDSSTDASIDFSFNLETMDEDMFTRYLSDSNF